MARDRFPEGANGKTREAWARRQIALAFGMRPHQAMLYLQGVVREVYGQGKKAGRSEPRSDSVTDPEADPVTKCEGCGSPSTTMDGDGIDLCGPCAKECATGGAS